MKLIKIIRLKSTFFIAALLLFGAANAAPISKEGMASQAAKLGLYLSELATAKNEEYCAFDVKYSGTILKKVASLIQNSQINLAESHLRFATRILERVAKNHHDCASLSAKVFPYIAMTEELTRELVAQLTELTINSRSH